MKSLPGCPLLIQRVCKGVRVAFGSLVTAAEYLALDEPNVFPSLSSVSPINRLNSPRRRSARCRSHRDVSWHVKAWPQGFEAEYGSGYPTHSKQKSLPFTVLRSRPKVPRNVPDLCPQEKHFCVTNHGSSRASTPQETQCATVKPSTPAYFTSLNDVKSQERT